MKIDEDCRINRPGFHETGQIIATSPQKVAFWKGNGTPYFREILVGELLLHLAR